VTFLKGLALSTGKIFTKKKGQKRKAQDTTRSSQLRVLRLALWEAGGRKLSTPARVHRATWRVVP